VATYGVTLCIRQYKDFVRNRAVVIGSALTDDVCYGGEIRREIQKDIINPVDWCPKSKGSKIFYPQDNDILAYSGRPLVRYCTQYVLHATEFYICSFIGTFLEITKFFKWV